MSTRACHLELLDDLSTDHFIIALKRFIVRRGRLQNIFSDNGTTFAGANNELQQYIGQLNEERIQDFHAPKENKRNLNPPSDLHVAGAWERLVQCTKETLKAILANRVVSKEALRTALVEPEGILNSRPITHASSDAGYIEALTPNHFLLLRANPSYEDAERSTRRTCGDSPKRWPTSFGGVLPKSTSLA